jgi:hypothetical protein
MNFARHRWLTPVILATQEVEIRRIASSSKPGREIVLKTLSQKKKKKKKTTRKGLAK